MSSFHSTIPPEEIPEFIAISESTYRAAVRSLALACIHLPSLADVEREARAELAGAVYCRTCRATVGGNSGHHRAAGHRVE